MSRIYPAGVDDEGNFDWAPAVWLTYHESFRREIARLTRAVDRFDPVQDAWKAIAMYRWLSEFFIPIIQHYEMGKRLFTVPFYSSKGYIIPDELNYSETFLQDFCTNIPVHAKEILDMAMSENLFPKKIKERVMHFKQEIHDLSKLLNSHYDAEERFWPAVYEKEGLEVWQKVLYRMLVHNRKVNPKSSNHIFAMVFHTIGYNLKYLSADDPLDTPWCGSKTRYTFVKRSPFIVKALPLVKWMQDYLKFKSMINAVFFESEDEQDFERRYRLMLQKQLHHQKQHEKWSHWMFNIFGHRYQHDSRQNQSLNATNTDTVNGDMKKLDNTSNVDAVYSFSMMDDNVSARSARSNSHHSKCSMNKNNSQSQMIAFAPEFQHAGSDVALFMNAEIVNSSNSPPVANNDPSVHQMNATNSTSSLTQVEPKKRNSSIWSLLFFRRNSQWSSSNLSTASTQSSDNNTNHNTNHGIKSINNAKYNNEKIEEETVETHALWVVKKQPSNSDTNKSNHSNQNSNNKILPVS